MRQTFAGYYRISGAQFKTLWQECVFALDANVLLNLYRYPRDASADLVSAFTQIKERLWVPYQAGLEYQENRLTVIAEQVSKFDEVRSVLTESQNALRNNLGKMQLRKRHSSIAADTFLETIAKTFADFTSQLDVLEKDQAGVSGTDALRDSIDVLLEGRVGTPPQNQKALDEIYEAGKQRYSEKRPPGYMDSAKKDFYLYGGLSFRREFGDFLLWEQIIQEAAKRKLRHLIFVTDDEKEDWWWIVDSKGKKTLGPRPELVEEIRRRAGVEIFYMYSSEGFLSYAREYLGTTVKPDSISQVRDVSKQSAWRARRRIGALVTELVYRWLQTRYPVDQISKQSGYPDFLVHLTDGHTIGFEVQYIWDTDELIRVTSLNFYDNRLRRPQSGSMSITFVFIASDRALARQIVERIPSGSAFHHVVGALGSKTDEPFELVYEESFR